MRSTLTKAKAVLLTAGLVLAASAIVPTTASAATYCAAGPSKPCMSDVRLSANNLRGNMIGVKHCATTIPIPSSTVSLTTSKTTTFTTTGTAGIGIDTHLVKFNASGAVSYAVAKTRTVTNTVVFPSIPVGQCAAAFELVDQYSYNLHYWWNSTINVKAGSEKHLDGITIQWVSP